MEEKIKIMVPKETYDLLINDCRNFDFFKNNGELNKNLFFNTIVINYYKSFTANEEIIKNDILDILNEFYDSQQNECLELLLNVITKNRIQDVKKKTEIINLKPTKLSEKAINDIQNNFINQSSISSFYRKLFNSYTQIPQNNRELIIYKENYDLILESIKKERKVCITLKNNEVINDASIYAIQPSKEEHYNYVLFTNKNDKPLTIRLNKIKFVSLLNSKRILEAETITLFNKQISYGVEFPLYSLNEEQVIVKLNDRGKQLFKKIYLYRPIPDKIEDNLYYFTCSHNQILYYFKRFGYDAMILSPTHLSKKMKDYYYYSSRKYDKLLFQLSNK